VVTAPTVVTVVTAARVPACQARPAGRAARVRAVVARAGLVPPGPATAVRVRAVRVLVARGRAR
jgi:hypothetical protein